MYLSRTIYQDGLSCCRLSCLLLVDRAISRCWLGLLLRYQIVLCCFSNMARFDVQNKWNNKINDSTDVESTQVDYHVLVGETRRDSWSTKIEQARPLIEQERDKPWKYNAPKCRPMPSADTTDVQIVTDNH